MSHGKQTKELRLTGTVGIFSIIVGITEERLPFQMHEDYYLKKSFPVIKLFVVFILIDLMTILNNDLRKDQIKKLIYTF